MKTLFVGVVILFSLGCYNQEVNKKYHTVSVEMAIKVLPPDVYNVEYIGNDWYIFSLKIEGKDHKFLYLARGFDGLITEIK